MDLLDPETIERISRQLNGTAISARDRSTLLPLIDRMETIIEKIAAD
jgi:hypothetical protein